MSEWRDEWREKNRESWDERVPIHASGEFYDAPRDDYTMFPRWPFLEKSGFDTYRPPEGAPKIPLMYSLRARKA